MTPTTAPTRTTAANSAMTPNLTPTRDPRPSARVRNPA